jgi:hypothetical protein
VFSTPPPRTRAVRIADAVFILLAVGLLVLLTTRYLMPFRLDDVLHMDWAREHSLLDAFHVQYGEIVRSIRPLFAVTIWLLTHTAGTESYVAWHVTLVASFFIGLAFTGVTARYIARKASALYITVSIFWIAFLPILNVLFWFGDLTFSIELMFVAAAWYYGIRGLCEGRLGLWIIGCFVGICAVLTKEPAILLVNIVFVGVFAFYGKEILAIWKRASKRQQLIGILVYLILIGICIKIFLASPTRGNRFFDTSKLSSEALNFFIYDRLRYYGEILSAPVTRLTLSFPLYYLLAESIRRFFSETRNTITISISIVAGLLLSLIITQPLLIIACFIAVPIIVYFSKTDHGDRALLLLPFGVCMAFIFSVLLITIMLVKTQLTEFAFCAIIVSGSCWSFLIGDIAIQYRNATASRPRTIGLVFVGLLAIAALAIVTGPKFSSRERLLREVQATRFNANDAVKWMANNLPKESTVLVTAPSLYGTANENDLTGLDDETKAFAQYTFLQGFVRVYFRQLNRPDLRLGYLEDSTMVSRVLSAVRSEGKTYLFLQSGRDWQRFHSGINGIPMLSFSDSMLVRFNKGAYASEVWRIGN